VYLLVPDTPDSSVQNLSPLIAFCWFKRLNISLFALIICLFAMQYLFVKKVKQVVLVRETIGFALQKHRF